MKTEPSQDPIMLRTETSPPTPAHTQAPGNLTAANPTASLSRMHIAPSSEPSKKRRRTSGQPEPRISEVAPDIQTLQRVSEALRTVSKCRRRAGAPPEELELEKQALHAEKETLLKILHDNDDKSKELEGELQRLSYQRSCHAQELARLEAELDLIGGTWRSLFDMEISLRNRYTHQTQSVHERMGHEREIMQEALARTDLDDDVDSDSDFVEAAEVSQY
ncbi:MAG: hypothetical protein Q9208_002176 [Pyrenodesmia sp. 3 TL-2023]